MSDLSELEALDANRPVSPPVLYKYVVPDRFDVLENASIRFTPPLNTNDIFEVRQTFDLVMGPKMHAYFKELSNEVDFEDALSSALKESPLSGFSNEQVKSLYSTLTGRDAEASVRGLLGHLIDGLPNLMNTPERIDQFLDRIASNQILLALSERPDSSPMWAHYAANSAGFVIAFKTTSEFFRRGDQLERQGLHKINYFDGRVPEIIDDPYAALISKQADWAYEREWRLYLKADQASQVLKTDGDEIHLVSFPREAVQRVILGVRASSDLEEQIRKLLNAAYPHASLTRAKADRTAATLTEVSASGEG